MTPRKSPPPSEGTVGRPPSFDRSEAIEGAMQLFWSRGFGTVSASELAGAMGIQRSSFYNTFGTRERVFEEALERYGAAAPDAALAELGPEDPVLPALARMLREVCRVRAADDEARGCMAVNAIAELSGTEAFGERLAAVVERRLALFERLVRQAVACGELPAVDDAPTTARLLFAFLAGLNTMSRTVRSERVLWRTCRAFLQGLGVADPDALLRARG